VVGKWVRTWRRPDGGHHDVKASGVRAHRRHGRRERADAAPTAASTAHQRQPQRTEVVGAGSASSRHPVKCILRSALGSETAILPAAQLSSAQLSPDRLSPTLHPAQLNACAYSPIKDCLSRSLTAACRIPDMAACDDGCIDPPCGTQIGSDTTLYNKLIHTDSYCRTPVISPCSGFSCRTRCAR
jgi:hypothetical protein